MLCIGSEDRVRLAITICPFDIPNTCIYVSVCIYIYYISVYI